MTLCRQPAPADEYGDDAGGHGASSRAVVWRGPTLLRVLDPLPGDYMLQGLGVNAAGRVVGMSGWPQRALTNDCGEASAA